MGNKVRPNVRCHGAVKGDDKDEDRGRRETTGVEVENGAKEGKKTISARRLWSR